MVKDENKRGSR